MHIIFHIAAKKISRTELRSDGKKDFIWICEGEKPSKELQRQIDAWMHAYIKGENASENLPLDLSAFTPFTRRVLEALIKIPYGERIAYAEVARRLGKPRSARAVGSACGRNPYLLLIPCHRVIASDGGLGGFGRGLSLKAELLAHEKN